MSAVPDCWCWMLARGLNSAGRNSAHPAPYPNAFTDGSSIARIKENPNNVGIVCYGSPDDLKVISLFNSLLPLGLVVLETRGLVTILACSGITVV